MEESRIKWYFSFYDRNLQVVWTKTIPLDEHMEYRFSAYHQDTLVMLFSLSGKKKGNAADYQILRILLNKSVFIVNQGMLPVNSEVAFFSHAHQQVWLGIKSKAIPDQLLHINLGSGNQRLFPLGEGSQISLRWMASDTSGQFIRAVVTRQVSKKSWEHYLVSYDTTGKIRNEKLIGNMSTDLNFTGFQVYSSGDGKDMVLGTYGINSEKESSGFFSKFFAAGTQNMTNFYHFLELHHAKDLLSEKDILGLKKKALKRNRKPGEYPLDFNLLLHTIFFREGEYILCGEIFSPQYHTESFTDFDFYGRPYSNSYSVFDGYRFTHALIAGFGHDGQLKWDNALNIRNLISYELSTKVSFFPSGENMVLCYLGDGRIGYKMIRANLEVEKTDYIPIEMLHPGDKLLTETRSRMIPWYGSYFLCSGYQEIKNVSLDNNNKRLVFYFTKIRFEE